MATLKEGQEITSKFTKEFFNLKGVYGTGTMICDCCKEPYIHTLLDKNIDKGVLNKIPDNYMGLKVVKEFGDMPVAQTSYKPDDKFKKFKDEFKGKDNYVIAVTKKGRNAIMNAPITGGYVPEDISILLEVNNQNKTIGELKQSPRKYESLEGLLIYLHTKGLISINGITSKHANNFSNVNGDDFSNARGRRHGGGGRRAMPRRRSIPRYVAPRRSIARRPIVRRSSGVHRGRTGGYYGRRYGWSWGVYPFFVYPSYAYYYNGNTPHQIKITQKGLKYLSLNPNMNIYTYFLTAVQSGLVYNERNLFDTLKMGQDYNDVVGWLHANKLIRFV